MRSTSQGMWELFTDDNRPRFAYHYQTHYSRPSKPHHALIVIVNFNSSFTSHQLLAQDKVILCRSASCTKLRGNQHNQFVGSCFFVQPHAEVFLIANLYLTIRPRSRFSCTLSSWSLLKWVQSVVHKITSSIHMLLTHTCGHTDLNLYK